MFFLFKIFLWAKRAIKLRYVKIGWLVTGGDLLYFSQSKSPEGLANGRGEAQGTGKRNLSGKYEAKPNSVFKSFEIIDIPIIISGVAVGSLLARLIIKELELLLL